MAALLSDWLKEIESTDSLKTWDDLRIKLLGKTGEITTLLKGLGQLSPEERREKGAEINQWRDQITAALMKKKDLLQTQALHAQLANEAIDITLPARPWTQGSLHPVTQTIEEIVNHFNKLGFQIASGPDIEDEAHNFDMLNIPAHHPARDSHDTFYVKANDEHGKPMVLRTHTSPVQIRTMKNQQPPIRILVPGRTYRSDYDATHTPMFHQIEGLIIDTDIHMGHLKACLLDFCRAFFEADNLNVRLRPSFFPFTEPAAELDVCCDRTQGKLTIGQGNDWLEVLGCGMVHPQVLRNCGIDPERYQGFAFGMGVERLAMLKYGIPDIRAFYESDTRWLSHYGFSPMRQPT